MSKASVEWIVGVIRVGENLENFGDPYEFSCTVIKRGTVAEIIGASGVFSRTAYREIIVALKAFDIETVTWDRKKLNKSKIINI